MLPVFDLHCDLLSYLTDIADADPENPDDIGAALPHLQAGGVRLQTMAIYTATDEQSVERGIEQSVAFLELLDNYDDYVQHLDEAEDWDEVAESNRTTIVAAIENASAFCGEDDDFDDGLAMFETILENTGGLLYVSLTHNDENRFGGGNDAPGIGLKDDGKVFLEYLSGMNIALDLSHASDALAREAIRHIDRYNLEIPLIASHSNFRGALAHQRNLPDDVAKEIIARGGLIGMNFYRPFLHESNPDALLEHILYGLSLGGDSCLAFGSDFFYAPPTDDEDDETGESYFDEHRNAAQFPAILRALQTNLSEEQIQRLAFVNAYNFLQRIWG
jgi:microsomal dipeptidase-like Zn-dependent dipeptidase